MKLIEQLEGRTLFASYAASTVAQLISAINSANSSGAADTITLAAGATFSLTAVNNSTSGATGLPQIAGGGGLTILGSGATIERSGAAGTPAFRLFDVASNGSLSLTNLTLQGGLALGASYLYAQGQAPGPRLAGVAKPPPGGRGADQGTRASGESLTPTRCACHSAPVRPALSSGTSATVGTILAPR